MFNRKIFLSIVWWTLNSKPFAFAGVCHCACVKQLCNSMYVQVLFCRLTDEQREVYQEYLDSRECQAILAGKFQVRCSNFSFGLFCWMCFTLKVNIFVDRSWIPLNQSENFVSCAKLMNCIIFNLVLQSVNFIAFGTACIFQINSLWYLVQCTTTLLNLLTYFLLPSTGQENNIAQPKPDKCRSSASHC